MDQTTNQFIDYLIYIGILNLDSKKKFLSCINGSFILNNKNNNNNTKPFLIKTLFDYLKNLKLKAIQTLSSQIVTRFYDNKYRANITLLTKLYNIYKKQQLKKKSNTFSFWKIRTNNPNAPFLFKEFQDEYINIYTKDSKVDTDSSNNNNNINNNIYLPNNTSYNSTPVLFTNNQLKQKRYLVDSNRTNSSSRIESFLQRQDNFIFSKNKNLENKIKLSEKKLNAIYTFSPHISSYYKHSNSDSIKPDNIKFNEDLLSKPNSKTNQKVYEYIYRNNYPKQKSKLIDKIKIEKLYNDYRQRQSRRKLLMEKTDYEDGITFKPRVNTSPSYFKNQDTFTNALNINTNSSKTQRNKTNVMTYDYYKEMELMEMRQNSLSKYIKYNTSK